MKNLFLNLILASIVVMNVSCSKNDPNKESEKTVFVKLASPNTDNAISRAVITPVANNTALTLNTGNLYFVTSGGQIALHMTISSSPTAGNNINITDIMNGYQIPNVPNNVATAYLVGNVSGLPEAGMFSVVQQAMVNINTQGTITSVALYGSGAVTPVSGNNYSATINVTAQIARLEITNITATGVITGFEVDGIFINNYYYQVQLNGTVSPSYIVNNGSTIANYVGGGANYPVSLPLYDYSSTGIGTLSALTLWPDVGHTDVWAYNVFPDAVMPHIVVRLSNITTNNGSNIPSPQFLTITKYTYGGSPLTAFQAGKVYNIGAGLLTFDETNLTPQPELGTIDVMVTANLIPFSTVNIVPEY